MILLLSKGNWCARVAKLADALDLGSSPERGGGSSPSSCTKKGVVGMEYESKHLVFALDQAESGEYQAKVTIKLPLVEAMYQQVLLEQKKNLQTDGFSKGSVPLSYIEYTYKNYILEHLKEFFFNHCIINFLCEEIKNNQVVIAGEPQLKKITMEPSKDAEFVFSFTQIRPEVKNEWKKYRFKAPGRKNYKDLDRQVETFLKEEEEKRKNYNPEAGIQLSDWVCFTLSVANEEDFCDLKLHKNVMWLKMGREDADRDAHALFLGRKVGDTFTTKSNYLQRYFSNKMDTHYLFEITIVDHISDAYFSVDQFKDHFKIKTLKEMHHKFIEVFSYRNDISQRREIIETAFKTLLKHYRIAIPSDLVDRQEQMVLKAVRRNPDYHVYKAQRDFDKKVRMLAEKQLQEAIIIDHLGYQENMNVTRDDVASYLNLLLRPRTKEFVCFDLPQTQMNGQEQPLPAGLVNQSCLREKTLNHIIRHLTS